MRGIGTHLQDTECASVCQQEEAFIIIMALERARQIAAAPLSLPVRRLKEHVFHIGARFIMSTLILEDGTPKRRHRARLDDLLATTKGIVRIASAYVTDRALLSDVGGRDTRLLISLLPMDIASGAMSLETLRWMLDSGIDIRVLPNRPRLHAKTYIFGMSVAIVTSANLTRSAFDSNLEVGVEVRGEDLAKLARWFDQLWQIAFPLTAEHLIELQSKTAAPRREFVKLKKQ
jgi:PLD-like domain